MRYAVDHLFERQSVVEERKLYEVAIRHGIGSVTPEGIAVSYAYNARGFTTRYTYGDNVSTYSYDAVGQKTNYTGPFGESTQYTYDAAHRLIDV